MLDALQTKRIVIKPYSYTNKTLIENGYASFGIHSLNFDRHFTEEEMEQNRQFSEQYGASSQEWLERCEQCGIEICEHMESMMKVLNEKYSISQYDPQVEYGKHDLHFYSNRGWNGKKWYDHIQLSFNDKLDANINNQILNELINLITEMELKNVACRVQYDTVTDDEKLYTDAAKRCKDLEGKFVSLMGTVGKIKEVGEYNGKKEYGFFKKGARRYYHPLSSQEIIFGISV